ncbi:MAG: NAD(P)-dependent oxidoreductase, partial [Pseudomonadota bacterium]
MRLGFIGLGAMGRPMAEHLLRGGHALSLWSRRPEAAAALVEAGAVACDAPAEVARRAEVVFTVVTTSADVAAVALGDAGLIHGFAPRSIHIDMSTIAPGMTRHIAARLAERDVAMLDAPVSGGATGARNATLAIMVGGAAETLARVRPLFDLLGKALVHVGGNGAGQVAKACNQMVMV